MHQNIGPCAAAYKRLTEKQKKIQISGVDNGRICRLEVVATVRGCDYNVFTEKIA